MISPKIEGKIAERPMKDGSIQNLIRAGNADNQVRLLERRASDVTRIWPSFMFILALKLTLCRGRQKKSKRNYTYYLHSDRP